MLQMWNIQKLKLLVSVLEKLMKFLPECFFKVFTSLVNPGYEVLVGLLFIMASFSNGLFPLAK